MIDLDQAQYLIDSCHVDRSFPLTNGFLGFSIGGVSVYLSCDKIIFKIHRFKGQGQISKVDQISYHLKKRKVFRKIQGTDSHCINSRLRSDIKVSNVVHKKIGILLSHILLSSGIDCDIYCNIFDLLGSQVNDHHVTSEISYNRYKIQDNTMENLVKKFRLNKPLRKFVYNKGWAYAELYKDLTLCPEKFIECMSKSGEPVKYVTVFNKRRKSLKYILSRIGRENLFRVLNSRSWNCEGNDWEVLSDMLTVLDNIPNKFKDFSDFHDTISSLHRKVKLENVFYEAPDNFKDEDISIEFMSNRHELIDFATDMHNCVSGYHNRIIDGYSNIARVVYKDKYYCIDVDSQFKINQIKGKCNESVSSEIINNIQEKVNYGYNRTLVSP